MAKRLRLTKKRSAWLAARPNVALRGSRLAHNVASGQRYAKRLEALTRRMTEETRKRIEALFRSETGQAHFAQDATIASQSRALMSELSANFSALFRKRAKDLATGMVKQADKQSAASLHSSLEKLSGGLSLKTKITSTPMEQVYKASVAENVGLIKSIASEYLQKVEGAVMRSITSGQGLQDLVPALEQYEGITHRRARNIALDQTRKAYNSINRERMQALGVKKFTWHHSGGGANPREDHIEMDGQVYRFDALPVIDKRTGERGIPGQAPNCKCTMSPVFDFEE